MLEGSEMKSGAVRYVVPSRFDEWNRAHRGAFLKGVKARHAGEPLSACPYEDHRKPSGMLSWSRAFIRAWQDGWRAAKVAK
jgi:ribosome modulation factor